MKKKIYYRFASLMLAVMCAFVSMPTGGLSGILTVYAEETTEEPTQEVDDVYFDAVNGVSYYYYGYSDGTAKIYNVTFSSGAVLDFPTSINTYTVTTISLSDVGTYDNRANVSVMTLPENVTLIEQNSFEYFDIGVLNYNTNAKNGIAVVGHVFGYATIGELNIGDNVNFIDNYMFYDATFLFNELTISVQTIGYKAFDGVWNETNPATLTLSEGIESVDYNAFASNYFDLVNYNCNITQSTWAGDNSIFHYSYIDALNIGSNVTVIADYMFYEAYFTFNELVLDVATIGEGAFGNIWSETHKGTLTLTENVTYLRPSALEFNYFETVNYNCSADGESSYNEEGQFYKSTIENLNIGASVTKIPAYAFFQSYFKFNELTLDVESIGQSAFYHLWAEEEAGKLTLTERVNFIAPSAFGYANCAEVNYYANATGSSSYNTQSIFYNASVEKLTIGDNVTTLPGWLFYQTSFGFNELTVNVAEINEYAFGNTWKESNPVTLTIGESVTSIYPKAFGSIYVRDLNYNSSATMPETSKGAFEDSVIYNFDIGENVETFGTYMFNRADIRDTDVIINAKNIEPYAFFYAWSSSYPVNLVIGESVELLDEKAFGGIYINDFHYNAVNASCATRFSGYYAPFHSCTITSLQLGDKVERLNTYLFYSIKLTQEDLKIPNSVKYIGNSVFLNSDNFNITNLYVGSGLEEIKYDSFGKALTPTNIYVEALAGNETYNKTSLTSTTAQNNLPIGENVYIHTNSDFYYYFTSKATNVTSYCVDHMVETVGDEYLDTITAQYVTPTYDTCEICEYQTTTYAYEDAHIVNFYVDGILYHTAYTKDNGTVTEPEEPTKEGYNFVGWDVELTNITADTTINAKFEIKTYTVTFKDYDGTVLETQTVEHGSFAFEPAEPTREGYTFKVWDKDYSNITADTEITATYDINYYNVTFVDYDGTILDTQSIAYGEAATTPTEPTREGYTFKGWSGVYDSISGHTTLTAVYEINKYTVKIYDYDGTILETLTIEHGSTANPTEPTREGYNFIGWDKDITNITEETTITALYEIKSYTVTFTDYDGTVLSTQTIEHGSSAIAPTEPTREGYDFMGWSHSFDNITSDMTIEATYMIKIFSVIFKDLENIISEQQIAYGGSATEPNAPTRPEEEWGQWIFKGWDTVWDYITGNTVINAIFDKVFNSYIVTFVDYDGTILDTQSIVHGENATFPVEPTREGYAFTGWDNSNENITGNRTITAQYQICYYTVTFVDFNGSVIDTQTVAYGGSATVPTEPVREGHTFKEWSGTWESIKKNETVTAVYDINTYTVTFKNYDGSVIDTQSVSYGGNAIEPETPIREGYDFTGWDKEFTNIQADMEITATYTVKILTVVFKDNTNIISTQQIEYGKDAIEPEKPSRPAEEWGVWVFKEWDNTWTNIKENTVINAVFDKKLNQYTVTFVDYNGSVLDTQTVYHGNAATAPTVSEREGYTFKQWDKDYSNVTENMIVTAVYEINTYTVTFADYDGSIIDTQSVKYQESATLPETPTRVGYTFKSWSGTWENITEDSTVTATYDINIYKVDFVDHDGTLIDSQSVEYGKGATAPTEPTREGYTFKQWDKDYSNVTENMTVTAVYEINSYTVTFVDHDGSIIDTQNVKYQESAILPETPTRVGYTFKTWQGTWENITENSTVTATYDINIYKVDFVDHDGTLIDSQSVEHGKSATAPENPTRDGYTFKNWDKDYSNITENLTVTAVYEKNHVHEYSEETERKEATCVEKGYVISKCSCGDTEKTELDIVPDNHTGKTEVKDQKAATCTEKGYSGDTYCKSCDTKIKDGTETDLAEHTPGETKVENRVEPTTEAKGSYDEVIYCEFCKKELSRNTVEIPIIISEEPDEPEDSEEEEEDTEDDDSEEEDTEEDDSEEEDTEEESESPIETESEEPTETEEAEPTETETPVIPTEPEEEEEPQIEDVVIPIAATAGVAGSTGTVYYVYWRRRRKIFGNVLDEQGNPVVNAKVYIEGSDVKETITDENGYFEYKNLKVGLYKFMLCNDLDVLLMEAEIYTEEKDIQNAVTTLESKCEVEAERIGKNISLILTIK